MDEPIEMHSPFFSSVGKEKVERAIDPGKTSLNIHQNQNGIIQRTR